MRFLLILALAALVLAPALTVSGQGVVVPSRALHGYAELYADAVASPMAVVLDADVNTFELVTHASIVGGQVGGTLSVDATADTIDAVVAGVYSIRFAVSTKGATGGTDTIHYSAYQEGVQLHNCELLEDMISSTSYARGAVVCLVTAAAGDTFDLRVNNRTDGTDIDIATLNFSLIRVGP